MIHLLTFLGFCLSVTLPASVHLPKLSPSMIIQYERKTLHPHLVLLHIPLASALKLLGGFLCNPVWHNTKMCLLFVPCCWHRAPKTLEFPEK